MSNLSVEEKLKELTKCELFLDNILIKDKTARQILVSAYNKLERQQKEIKKEKSRIMELAELLDKQENEIKFLKGELEIQKGCSISKDKIKEKINELETLYNCNLDTALTSYEMFHFVRSYIDKVKNILNELLEDN